MCKDKKIKISNSGGGDYPELPYTDVQVIEEKSDNTESSYRVEATLAGTDLSAIGQTLTEKLTQEWDTYEIVPATYEQNTVTTKSGTPVLIVHTNGYFDGDYYDSTAYWVKENVFYTLRVFGKALRVFGKAGDKADIQAALDRILAEI